MLFAVGTFIIRTDGHLWQGRTSGPTLPKGKKEAGGLVGPSRRLEKDERKEAVGDQ